MNGLKNKVVLVAGGAGYLGEEVCRKFIAEGAHVMIADMAIERSRSLPPMKVNPIDYGISKVRIEQMIRDLAVYWERKKSASTGSLPAPFPTRTPQTIKWMQDISHLKIAWRTKSPWDVSDRRRKSQAQ
jgi:NAD(P)-dependent dehydrogenase (short-subunit alcohol dehydrogenase family)